MFNYFNLIVTRTSSWELVLVCRLYVLFITAPCPAFTVATEYVSYLLPLRSRTFLLNLVSFLMWSKWFDSLSWKSYNTIFSFHSFMTLYSICSQILLRSSLCILVLNFFKYLTRLFLILNISQLQRGYTPYKTYYLCTLDKWNTIKNCLKLITCNQRDSVRCVQAMKYSTWRYSNTLIIFACV